MALGKGERERRHLMPAPKFSSVFNLKPKKAISSQKEKKKSQIAQEEGKTKA
jgi:hypothetical protein